MERDRDSTVWGFAFLLRTMEATLTRFLKDDDQSLDASQLLLQVAEPDWSEQVLWQVN